MADHPTTTWEAMQDGKVFYRRQEVYSIARQLPNLSDHIVAGCRYGGPLALLRDTSKVIQLSNSATIYARGQIQVYSPAGEGLAIFSWDQAKIVRFGWAQDERLVVLNDEGVYRIYDLQGAFTQFSLGSEAADAGIVDARIYEGGMVAMTGSLTFMEVKGWEGAKPLSLANPGLSQPPHTWSVIPPDLAISRYAEVLLSVDTTIISVDTLSSTDQRLGRGPFSHIAPSPNGKSLALLTSSGTLWVVSSDLQRNLAEFDVNTVSSANDVRQVEWCGNDAILVTWDVMAVLVGPFGDTLRYYYSGPTFAITEPDGVRIIGPDSCDFVEKVPSSTLSIFRPGSTSPAAILYDAWESFARRSPKADDSIRSIRPELAAAVNDCIDAAGREWEPQWQRKLLSAAKFGRGFLDLYDPTDFVNMGQTLKVLNAVRFHEIGIPITYAEYTLASPSHLISRLTARNLHLLALRISNYLSLKPDTVLRHWACAKIARAKPSAGDTEGGTTDDEVCALIVKKFRELGGGSANYAEIAKRAWEVGRAGLATKLLDYEPRASDQVPLLLSMKEDRLALAKAVDSGDTDLVYHVLLHLHKRLPLGSFFRLIEDGGERLAPANKLLQVYARQQNREMLRDFYYSDDRRVESAVLSLEEAAAVSDPFAKISCIKAAQKFFSEDKDRSFEAKMMDENVRLLAAQQQLEKESDGKIAAFGTSVNETIRACLLNGYPKKADKLKSDFKVPDKRFWYVKLQALTALSDWDGLETFAKSKRSPIGYEPFVRHLLEKGHPREAATYVARCESNKRVDLYIECGDWRAAGKECKERNDKLKLEQLRKSAPNSVISRELDAIANSMK
ncbi:vacuolar assembling/sorting protein VPS16 [Punctularia strigosozonata HHB-11173 SS5]|uniref:vacuolar assembling/sorting protein VPS16 n=1 Tax=Punctularia strigosozonata (strain HHB-11173) TaxID=741275 RepID=UPI0004417DB5|nr:vacuolar assembling/sorting protein VPS16 [Punctularia strigosozonata HHB-11173 SS5]EIN08291.1 vacuolar assembling/sorting protein VPS16 [Punctularia strigosozonata HHB-11173 SS5]